MTWSIRPATTKEAELARIAEISVLVTPDDPTSVEELHWADRTYPGTVRFVAEAAGSIVGTASVGRIYMYPETFDGLYADIAVLPSNRQQGIGGALYEALSVVARDRAKAALHIRVSEARPEGETFLAHRGFTVYERSKGVRLDLTRVPGGSPAIRAPAGIAIVQLAGRPELIEGIHRVAVESFGDVPGMGEPVAAGDLAEFRARDVDRPGIQHELFAVALDEADGSVVGYASITLVPGSLVVGWHDMTAVRPAWRGRGIAQALKRATITWSIDAGLIALETGNDVANAPMRAVNARLGYEPVSDLLIMRGPLAEGIMRS